MEMDALTSGGTRLQPARFHFQPAWFPTLAKPAGKQSTGERERREINQDAIADVLWGWETIRHLLLLHLLLLLLLFIIVIVAVGAAEFQRCR